MDQTVNGINKQFYNNIAERFSRSRQKNWTGWDGITKYIRNGSTIADLGCGDGRFYKFLKDNKINVNYTGYDISSNLLDLAKKSYPEVNFVEADITKEALGRNYDVECVFGLLHHISNIKELNIFINKVIANLNKDGYLIVTFWLFNPEREKVFNSKARELGITLNNNDYLLDWGGAGTDLRFCHRYTNEEIEIFKQNLIKQNYTLVDQFTADKANLYLVFKK